LAPAKAPSFAGVADRVERRAFAAALVDGQARRPARARPQTLRPI
jgi:hypothetical protein